MTNPDAQISGWERSLIAAERVKDRLRRATRALENAGVPYAVVGENAVAEWVARVDSGAVRNTRDVDLLIRRPNLPAARTALESVGFIYRRLADADTFGEDGIGILSVGVRLLYIGERVSANCDCVAPDLDESERTAEFQVATLPAVVGIELAAWRSVNRMYLRDLIDVGLVDSSWPARFPPPLGDRLQELLDDPNA